jgi:hypothetical protein
MAPRLLSWLENIEGKYRITEVMVRPRVGLKDKAELECAREIMESVKAQLSLSQIKSGHIDDGDRPGSGGRQ